MLERPVLLESGPLIRVSMGLSAGAHLGPYEVQSAIGAGGMGEVWKARDTILGRDVALKIVPDHLAVDPDRLARLKREAQILASLNHPHIATIYGFHEGQGVRALVLEFVEGPTLADRLAHGSIPIAETLSIAHQIAEALEAAHQQGIVHRDLKPANIKLRPGAVKVLDFGLAKSLNSDGTSPAELSLAPTITSPAMTQAGVILGTAPYMSPEQVRGQPVDHRSDVWAFGCVVFEMLTGRRAFQGDTVQDVLASVLNASPDWNRLPDETPTSIRQLLRRCLQKDQTARLPYAGYARLEIENASDEDAARGEPPRTSTSQRALKHWPVMGWASGVLVGALAAGVAVRYSTTGTDAPEMRLDISTPATNTPNSFALSPDGRQIVFAASLNGESRLWLRLLGNGMAKPVTGTEGASMPFWSPDSQSLAFFANGNLKRVDLGGGLPQTLARADSARGGSWSPLGVIVFAADAFGTLLKVPASGGEVVAATRLEPGQTSHRFPQFLADGRRFLYLVTTQISADGNIYLGSLDSPATKRLITASSSAVQVPPDWLLFVRQGSLVTQRVDLTSGQPIGSALTVADSLAVDSIGGPGIPAFSVSSQGLVAYRPRGASGRQLTWFDRSGNELGTIGPQDETIMAPSLSPDGHQVALHRSLQGNTDVWLFDGTRATRFTTDASPDFFPVWSPDGTQVAFSSTRSGSTNIVEKKAIGAADDQLLLASPVTAIPDDWSPDGRFLLYYYDDPKDDKAPGVWVLPMDHKDAKPFAFLDTAFDERQSQFSPDGRWVAYQSNESGRFEIFVRPFPPPAEGQWQVSTGGGSQPRWRRDGRELYYIAPDGKLMAAPIAAEGGKIAPGAPVSLFQTRIWGGGTNDRFRHQYAVAADGRFLIDVGVEENVAPLALILNWKPRAQGN